MTKNYFKALIGTVALVSLNNVGLIAAWSDNIYLKVVGHIDYFITTVFLWVIILNYFDSPFYKNLGKEAHTND